MTSYSTYRYFTTPIYYANGKPHAGHIYATLLGSIMKSHYLHRGMDVKFMTGLDEHGEAVQDKAKELNITPQDLVDKMADLWKDEFARFEINNDIFMRTTDASHVKNVQDILNYCYKKGDIYFGEHEGYYCIKCEGFLNSNERDENNNCLIHKRPTELRKEKNYFFRTTKYFKQLRELISQGRITTQTRYIHELLGIIDHLEGDLSISRPKTRLGWGIELPFDSDHIAYVWFDALPNYVTGIGGLEAARSSKYWENAYHILGKDILKFHGIFWPAMCLSLEIPLPKLLLTGWLLKDSHKMSKSLGNIITPEQILHYGRDMFVNEVFRSINPGDDIDISWKSYFERYNSALVNGIGNLLARTLAMIEKYFDKIIPSFSKPHLLPEQKEIEIAAHNTVHNVAQAFDEFRLADALNEIWAMISLADKHITIQKPWDLAKKNDAESRVTLGNILATSIAVIRIVGYLANPFFPKKMNELLVSIGEDPAQLAKAYVKAQSFTDINSGYVLQGIPKLYERLDIAAELAAMQVQADNAGSAAGSLRATGVNAEGQTANLRPGDKETSRNNTISIDDFSKVSIRVATIISAEYVEGSDKLLKLIVSLGEKEKRQIFSGIREWVTPEETVNRKVVIVANLIPRKMKFGLSDGMLLTTETIDGKVTPVYLPEDVQEGSRLT